MKRKQTLAIALSALLTLSLVAMAGLAVGSVAVSDTNETYVDDDHYIATDDGIEEWQEEAVVSDHVGDVDLELTVAESSDDVGVDRITQTDFNGVYLRADYAEDIERSVRVYVPAEMWHPHTKQGETSIDGEIEADFQPTGDHKFTAVTLHFDGQSDDVFRISKETATIFKIRDGGTSFVEETFGVETPKIISSTDWEYPEDAFDGNESTIAIEHQGDIAIEYDSLERPSQERWLNVPRCDSSSASDAPVCKFDRQGVENTTYVATQVSDVPDIRYTEERSLLDSVRSTVTNDLRQAWDEIKDAIDSLVPSSESLGVDVW